MAIKPSTAWRVCDYTSRRDETLVTNANFPSLTLSLRRPRVHRLFAPFFFLPPPFSSLLPVYDAKTRNDLIIENDNPRQSDTHRCDRMDFFAGIRSLQAYKHMYEYLDYSRLLQIYKVSNESELI